MNNSSTSSKILKQLIWVVIFSALVIIALVWFRSELIPFFMTRPSINSAVMLLGLVGLLLSLKELARFLNQARQMDLLSGETRRREGAFERAVDALNNGLVKDRSLRTLEIQKFGAANMDALAMISDADIETEESKGAFVRYIVGVMVFLGLIGTFWGVLITVSGVHRVLEALDPSKIDDPVAFVTQLKTSMAGLLGGLSTAFSTSLFGLAGSVILGFIDLQTRKAKSALLSDLDRFAVSVMVPSLQRADSVAVAAPTFPADEKDDQIYLMASQQALGDNLRRLTEVIERQCAMDAKVTETLMEIKGAIDLLKQDDSTIRDSIKSTNSGIQALAEKMDNAGKQMERLVKETRIGRDSFDDGNKALVERIKLEGEITNKTLSKGFAEIIRNLSRQDKRADRDEVNAP